MKRFLSILLIVLLLIATFTFADAENVKLAYKGGSIKLRTGPGKGYGYTQYLKDGAYITVLQKGSTWSKVKTTGGKTGYIKSLYISGIGNMYADGTTYWKSFKMGYTTGSVHLRAGASTSADTIAYLSKGTKVKGLGKNGSFYLVELADGTQGFVSGKYIGQSSSGGSTAPKTYAKVTGTWVYMRKGPSVDYADIMLIKMGSKVTVVSTANSKWWKISYKGKTGYMWSKYLKLV
ncbi:MAG: SH3 domain-containing protein [Clostridiales bacterium]|nr:SH3 domain-containing protein [Clostridiales bacterium]